MLQSLLIKNYAIIDEVLLSFNKGYNVITGETGAGKSILLGALNLIRGARADTRILYNEHSKCTVEAIFHLDAELLAPLNGEIQADFEGKEVIIRREISSTGKSRAFINDTPVRLSELKQLTSIIIDIHNQFDTLSITQPEYQLDVVDAVASNEQIKRQYQNEYYEYVRLKGELRRLEEAKKKKIQDLDYAKFQLEELTQIPLDEIVKQELIHEQSTLENSERILTILNQMSHELQESDHALTNHLSSFLKQLNDLGELNPQLSEIKDNLEHALELLNEVDYIGNRLVDQIDLSDERLQELTETLDHIHRLERKHSVDSIAELIRLRDQYQLHVETSMNIDDIIEEKRNELAKSQAVTIQKANNLTNSRLEIFPKLTQILERSLIQLAIPNAKIRIERKELEEFEESGKDAITFSFSANKGVDVQPIAEVASGGELSRVALSVKSTIADQYGVPTLIFDEIDTGISGAVAKRVGEIFQNIAENRQVICITHSPQVASLAEQHFLVEKRDTEKRTITSVQLLDRSGRIDEIAKMLSTDPPSGSAVQNAKELLGYTD